MLKEMISKLAAIYRRVFELMEGPRVTCVFVSDEVPKGHMPKLMDEAARFVNAGVEIPCIVVVDNHKYYLDTQVADPIVPKGIMVTFVSDVFRPRKRQPTYRMEDVIQF